MSAPLLFSFVFFKSVMSLAFFFFVAAFFLFFFCFAFRIVLVHAWVSERVSECGNGVCLFVWHRHNHMLHWDWFDWVGGWVAFRLSNGCVRYNKRPTTNQTEFNSSWSLLKNLSVIVEFREFLYFEFSFGLNWTRFSNLWPMVLTSPLDYHHSHRSSRSVFSSSSFFFFFSRCVCSF